MSILSTTKNVNGHDWQITTSKKHSGKIATTAQRGKKTKYGFEFAMLSDPNITLHTSGATRATSKALTECHEIGLLNFDDNPEIMTKSPKREGLQPGQIIFTHGYDNERRRVIIKEATTEYGSKYFETVVLDSLAIGRDDHIRPFTEKFGIGTYYHEGDMYEGDIEELYNKAVCKAEEDRKAEEIRKAKEAEETARKIEEGKKLVSVPEWAKSVILCHVKEDDSDPYSDYYSHSISKTYYLAWSSHTRDLFSEMRKAAKNCEKTAYMADLPKDCENREKYSMGSGYYLGESSHSGYEIRKGSINKNDLDYLYIAAAEGRFFCPTEEPKTEKKPTQKASTKGVEIIDYSEKAIAVIGNTKEIKDTLKSLGGRFNPRLSCGMGWVFPKAKGEALRAALA